MCTDFCYTSPKLKFSMVRNHFCEILLYPMILHSQILLSFPMSGKVNFPDLIIHIFSPTCHTHPTFHTTFQQSCLPYLHHNLQVLTKTSTNHSKLRPFTQHLVNICKHLASYIQPHTLGIAHPGHHPTPCCLPDFILLKLFLASMTYTSCMPYHVVSILDTELTKQTHTLRSHFNENTNKKKDQVSVFSPKFTGPVEMNPRIPHLKEQS